MGDTRYQKNWKTSRLSPGFLMLSGNLGTLVTQFEIVVEIELIATCLPDCLRPPQGRRLSADASPLDDWLWSCRDP